MAEVSIIIPVYNVEKYINRCVDSVLAQTFTNFELILVDDGSFDNSGVICDNFADKDARVSVIHKDNGGVSSARNVALDSAKGKYIVFIDSDDAVSPTYINELMQYKDYDFVTAGYRWQSSDMTWHFRKFEEEAVSQDTLKAFPSKYMGKYYFGSPWATLMKKELIDKGNIRFNMEIHSGEDTLFIFKYLECVSTVKIVPFCGYDYYYYPSSLVNKRHQNLWKWKIIIEAAILDFFKPCNQTEVNSLKDRCFDVLRDLLRDYSKQMTDNELQIIYNNEFFKDCIDYKKKNGAFKEKILIFAMEHKKYSIYTKWMQIDFFFFRVKRRLKLIFKYKGNCYGANKG